MQELSALIGIVVALIFGAMSPGPSFVMVSRTAASQSRADGLYAALGMGLGGLLFAIASLLGLHGLLLAVPSLYWILVALALSASASGNAYLRFKSWMDRAAGGIMVALGLKLISSAGRSA